jgi:Flp pilus assembly protein TadD
LRASGDAAGAEHSYREALARDPRQVDARIALGGLLLDRGEVDAALAELERALPRRPGNPHLHAYLGAAHGLRGTPGRALTHTRRAVELAPDDGAYRELLAGALHRAGRNEEARSEYRIALALGRDSPGVRNNLAWLLLDLGDDASLEEALAHAEVAATATDRADPRVLDTLAEALARGGRWDEALATAQQALPLAREQGETALAERLAAALVRYRLRLSR